MKSESILAAAAAVVVIGGAGAALYHVRSARQPEPPSIITISTLEKILDVSQLSTFTAVYNGIAEVKNTSDPEKIDYYVAYEAKVKAGLDFAAIQMQQNEESKTITITLPDVTISDVNVDIGSMDFIFNDKSLNQSTISAQAYQACEEDAAAESAAQSAIFDLAQQNAVNVVTALTKPLVQQLDANYTLIVQ